MIHPLSSKSIRSLVVGLVMSGTGLLQVPHAAAQCPPKDQVESVIAVYSKEHAEITSLLPTGFPGLCEVRVRSEGRQGVLYMDAEGKFLLIGQLVEVATGRNLTLEIMDSFRRFTPEEMVKLKELSAFTLGSSGPEILFVTDPQCPFCKEAQAELRQLVDRGKITARFLLYPLPMHEGAREQSISTVCDSKGVDEFERGYRSENQCEEGKRKIDETARLVSQKGITGTPAYIFPDGRIHMGVLTGDALLENLGLEQKKEGDSKEEKSEKLQ